MAETSLGAKSLRRTEPHGGQKIEASERAR